MILQLREIFQIEGMHLPVDYTISLEELSEVRGYTFAAPVYRASFRTVPVS